MNNANHIEESQTDQADENEPTSAYDQATQEERDASSRCPTCWSLDFVPDCVYCGAKAVRS